MYSSLLIWRKEEGGEKKLFKMRARRPANSCEGKGCCGEAVCPGEPGCSVAAILQSRNAAARRGSDRSRFCSRRRETGLIVCSGEDDWSFPEGYCSNESQLCHTELFLY